MSGQISFEDITVLWGRPPDPLDQQTFHWREAIFQDLQISSDGTHHFFLYDPIAEERANSPRKGPPSIVLFDANSRKFIADIPLGSFSRPNVEGVLKYFFLTAETAGPGEGPSFVICTQIEQHNQLNFWSVVLSPDRRSLRKLDQLYGPVPVGEDWIVTMREDAPEVVLLTGPGLSVWRISTAIGSISSHQQPIDSYSVPDGDLRRYYDAFIWRGMVYLLSARQDESFDFNPVYILDIAGRSSMRPVNTTADPQRGFPPYRKQTGIDIIHGKLCIVGGEIIYPDGNIHRLVDLWTLDLNTFVWTQMAAQLPLPLIEPRVSSTSSGMMFVWGDCDIPTGCISQRTHLHIIRLNGMISASDVPPPYPGAPGAPPSGGSGFNAPSAPPPPGPYQQPPSYPGQNPQDPLNPPGGGGGYPPQQPYGQPAPGSDPYRQDKPPAPYGQGQPQPPGPSAYGQQPPTPYGQPSSPAPYGQPYGQPQQGPYGQGQPYYPQQQPPYGGQGPQQGYNYGPPPSGSIPPDAGGKKDCIIS